MSQQTGQEQDSREIQAFRFYVDGPKNETECARVVCHSFGWRFNSDDQVTETDGTVIGLTIEDIAAAMVDSRWVQRLDGGGGWVPMWSDVPDSFSSADSHEAAEKLREFLDEGRHEGWRAAVRRQH